MGGELVGRRAAAVRSAQRGQRQPGEHRLPDHRLEVWSITEGFRTVANGQGTRDVKDPMKAIDHVIRAEGRALFVLRDFHPFLKEPAVIRRLRDAATELRKTKKSLCVLSPITKIPPELEKSISAVLDWELPNRTEIESAARKVLPNLPAATDRSTLLLVWLDRNAAGDHSVIGAEVTRDGRRVGPERILVQGGTGPGGVTPVPPHGFPSPPPPPPPIP